MMIILFGFVWLGWTISVPILFAGEYMSIGIMIVIFGFAIVSLEHKSARKKAGLQSS